MPETTIAGANALAAAALKAQSDENKPASKPDRIRTLHAEGKSVAEIAAEVGTSQKLVNATLNAGTLVPNDKPGDTRLSDKQKQALAKRVRDDVSSGKLQRNAHTEAVGKSGDVDAVAREAGVSAAAVQAAITVPSEQPKPKRASSTPRKGTPAPSAEARTPQGGKPTGGKGANKPATGKAKTAKPKGQGRPRGTYSDRLPELYADLGKLCERFKNQCAGKDGKLNIDKLVQANRASVRAGTETPLTKAVASIEKKYTASLSTVARHYTAHLKARA